MDGLTLCGGGNTGTTCISFTSGKWVTSHALAEESWYNKEEGKIILMGGYFNPTTTEIITEGENGGVPGFPMKHDTW